MRNNLYYRPEWTIGRYDAEKHVALMYNLIAGASYFFEKESADVIAEVINAGRNGFVNIQNISVKKGIKSESVEEFFMQLLQYGLLTDTIPTKESISIYRKEIANIKHAMLTHQSKMDTLPKDAEKAFFAAVGHDKMVGSAIFELTYRCSEKCIHCYNFGATRNDTEVSHRAMRDELSIDDYKRIIDEMCTLGLTKVCLTGGDPFSKEITWDILDYLYEKEVAIDIYTNAQLLVKHVNRLANYYPRSISISIYSGIPEVHDAITRTPGAWEKSMKVAKELSELAIPLAFKCCIMQPNLHSYFLVLDLAKKYNAHTQFDVDIIESADGDLFPKQLRLTEDQLQLVLRDENVELYVGKEAIEAAKTRIDRSKHACYAAEYNFCVSPNGNVHACPTFNQIYGNLKNQTMLEVLTSSPTLKEWRNSTMKDFEECGTYKYCGFCNLCPGTNYAEHGDFRKPSETNCFMAKCRFRLAQTIQNEEKPLDRKQLIEAIKKLPVKEFELHRMYRKG